MYYKLLSVEWIFEEMARSHRQNFAGAVLERYGDESNFDNARHRAQNLGENRKHGRC